MNKALLIGINKYVNAPLRGCVNDVQNMKNILDQHNFEIQTLLDEQATKQNILDQIQWLINTSQPNDHLILQYSGHGSQVPDINGDESDRLDEILCPFDLVNQYGQWSQNWITDDQLSSILSNAHPESIVEVFLDCCHSGTGTRSFEFNPNQPISKFMPPPPELTINPAATKSIGIRGNSSFITWSGCKSDQTSADAYINGSFNGAFTFCFVQSFNLNNRLEIFNNLVKLCKSMGFQQDPELSCIEPFLNRKLF